MGVFKAEYRWNNHYKNLILNFVAEEISFQRYQGISTLIIDERVRIFTNLSIIESLLY